ncbi:MAG: Abi family protein [Sulfuricurvum sp.]|jgi:abortive infection bacteriophage resistance protein|uniref:Abi family protein n=1 Tax=Sulfuricurvum sp. TaxID=2025608 RepID=UPI0025E0813F|nr:Abi family protein [Sulfuricurvum sp.]MCK9373032.1 Abi family protein [Sulfuricurvum sp.]
MTSDLPQSYNKSFKTIDEQIELLKSRGMLFRDEDQAKHYLLNLNYYRLSGYWLPFKQPDDSFESNLYFEDIINLYLFDSGLKGLLYQALETIEISAKTKFAYYLAQAHGPHPLKTENFTNGYYFAQSYAKLQSEIERQKDRNFIKHYREKYAEELPPLWVCVEVMTFGLLSQLTKNIKNTKVKREIARCYDLDMKIFESVLYHLSTIRNHIAHHSRLYNHTSEITFGIPKILENQCNKNLLGSIYNTIVMCDYILKKIEPNSVLMKDVLELADKHRINKSMMGFTNYQVKI